MTGTVRPSSAQRAIDRRGSIVFRVEDDELPASYGLTPGEQSRESFFMVFIDWPKLLVAISLSLSLVMDDALFLERRLFETLKIWHPFPKSFVSSIRMNRIFGQKSLRKDE